ncbi:putative DNA PACKAGING PROTEIN GP2 [Achromobacter xylosoxidans NBRC 15126 = ATCC 27061]|nr:putative DNA PACKAGING PROTEIN GP2 [Achromobacter xylosoxidans NBRC 15126 = ATCC 27061]
MKYHRPYEKQREFHAQGAAYGERLFSAGNQLGKTFPGAYETAMHLTGRYPEWWEGKVFQKPTAGWAASVSSALTRDGMQRLLLGRPGVD